MSHYKYRRDLNRPLEAFTAKGSLRYHASKRLTHITISCDHSVFVPRFDLQWHQDRYHIKVLIDGEAPRSCWTVHDAEDLGIFIDLLKSWIDLRSGRHESTCRR